MRFSDKTFQQAWKGAKVCLAKHPRKIAGMTKEDIKQEVFMHLWRKREKIDESKSENSIFSWGYGMAKKKMIDLYRKYNRRDHDSTELMGDIITEDDFDDHSELEDILMYLKSNNPYYYHVLKLFIESKGDISCAARWSNLSRKKFKEKLVEMSRNPEVSRIIGRMI